jgi:hypothetical protein
MNRGIAAAVIAAIATMAAGPPPGPTSAFDFQYASTAAGRAQYMDTVAATFGPMVALAPICHLRSQEWADTLETYPTALLSGPIKVSGEDVSTRTEVSYGLAALKFTKAEAAKDFIHDPTGACKDVRKDPDLADADHAVKAVNTPADPSNPWADPSNPWAGAGGKP